MNETIIKYGGGAVVAVAMVAGGNYMTGQEEAALIEQYELEPAQVMLMKFCVSDLDRTDLTYEKDTSDRKICGCIADKINVSAEFYPVLEAGIDRYTTHSGNMATTGVELADQMNQSISNGVTPASMRTNIDRFGKDYQLGERLCLMTLD